MFGRFFSARPVRRLSDRRARLTLELLETRLAPSVNVLSYQDGTTNSGVDSSEVQLTPANVKVGSFGRLSTTGVDGQVYAEPLVMTGVTITNGPNTVAGAAGVHDVVFVATEHDSLYAIDAGASAGGVILWQRSFLDLSADDALPGATSVTTVPSADTGSTDISPEIGITGTPVIDASTDTLYVVVATKEMVGGVAYYVQRLHAINVADGTDRATPFLIGDTTGNNTNNTPIYVYGTGDGAVTDPYNGTGKDVVQFNALTENERSALALVNNEVYVEWASHGDNGPYHGWVAAWNVANVSSSGMVLAGVFNTSPNGGEAGIWMGAGKPAFEPDGSAFFFETGNGSANAPTVVNSAGFPANGDYYEAVVKVVPDPTTSATNQNINGWGFKAADYFIPYNQPALDNADQDLGSGAPLLLPASAGIPGYPDLLLAAGKEGTIYVINADNMGKFDANNDDVLNAVPDGSGHNAPPVQIDGSLSTPIYFNGTIYWVSGYSGPAEALTLGSTGTLSITSQTTDIFGYIPGSPEISSNGTQDGILWVMDRNDNELHAYDASSLSIELWNSDQKAGSADAVGAVVKFAAPTVANGEVFVGTTDSLVIYGLTPPANAVPATPTLSATALSGSAINLAWTDPTTPPNTATGYLIEESSDGGATFQQVTTAPAGANTIDIGGLSPQTTYSFRIRGYNGLGDSDYSNVAGATTTTSQALVEDFSGGFADATNLLTFNGSADINGTMGELTNGGYNQAGSFFTTAPVNVSSFSTQFTFNQNAGDADGMTFCIQGNSPAALGPSGGGLGYGPDTTGGTGGIPNSMAIKFDLFSNEGEGPDSTGLFTDGAAPTINGSIDLSNSPIDFHSGDTFQVNMTYDGTNLTVIITDTVTGQSESQVYAVNIPSLVGGSTAYVGFTGGTGGLASTQDVLTWTFSNAAAATQAPAAPSALGAVPASATSVALTWTNNATNQTGFLLDRATDPNFTQNLITQTLPASPNTFTDTANGLAPGSTFYYRLRAVNAAGDSVSSNVVTVSIPLAPPKPTNAAVTNVTSSEIDLSWTDNAGRAAEGYYVLRAVNFGSFTVYATLPQLNTTPPSTYTWSDTNVSPGTFYEYHIQAYNVSGNNDFAGTNAYTLTTPPTDLTAKAGTGAVTLSWVAPLGAVSYNLYRGTTPGGEGATPIATGVTQTSYTDSTVTNGQTYYYEVTAVNANLAPLASESAASAEVSALPSSQSTVLNFSNGFTGSTAQLTYNGSAAINGTMAELTNGSYNTAGSVFSTSPVNVSQFTTQFTINQNAGDGDGMTFCIQGNSPTALGPMGGGLGYGPDAAGGTGGISKSMAIKFDLFSNAGEGPDSTGLFTNGASPTNVGSVNLSNTGINFHSGDPMLVTMIYNGTTLDVTIQDTDTGSIANQDYTVNIPALTGSTAYVGFTGATGGLASTQDVVFWTFTSNSSTVPAPAAPSNLTATAASGPSVTLTWTNNATNETGFHLDRATDPNFTQNLITQDLPASPTAFTDTAAGLTPGSTYYYRLRAFNQGGDSASSNVGSVTIPAPPANQGVVLDFSSGFASSKSLLTYNGSAAINGAMAELTNGSYNAAGSVFSTTPVNVTAFTTQFTINQNAGDGDGMTFCIQGNAPTALGPMGGGLGYGPDATGGTGGIPNSMAIKFDLYSNQGEGPDSTGLFTDGAAPTDIGSINLTSTGINLHSGDTMLVTMTYNGTTLDVTIKDNVTGASASHDYTVNIPALTGSEAYVGFTGATGGLASTQDVLTWTFANTASPPSNLGPALNFGNGFAGSNSLLTYNGSAAINGTMAELTNGSYNTAGSVFSTTPVNVTAFTTQFTINQNAGDGDGMTFCIQGNAPTALGPMGGGLGYGPDATGGTGGIPNSLAIKFDLYSNQGEGPDSTGLFTDGAAPTDVGSINLTSTGIDLHSGDPMLVTMTYNGTTLDVTIKDNVTGASASQDYTVNIPALTGSEAYVGFTGATAGLASTQDILSWTFNNTNATQQPAAPTGLTGTQVADPTIKLTWSYKGTSENGFLVDRATNPSFTQNLVTQDVPASARSFIDTTGLSPGDTYYYRLRAFNQAGDSTATNLATVALPPLPAVPTNAQVTRVTAAEIDLSWTDNAGKTASGYTILRSVNQGAYKPYVTLPALKVTVPTTYTWKNFGVLPGTLYQYRIVAFNISGSSAFAAASAETLTLPPTYVAAKSGTGVVNLTWAAPVGAVSYNIYRGTTYGREGTAPIATGVTLTSYSDHTVANGVTYFYEVTAVNANAATLPSQSSPSLQAGVVSLWTPAAPTNLSAANRGNVTIPEVVLTWTASTAATAYNIYRATSSNGEGAVPLYRDVIGTTFIDPHVANGTTYYYEVTALNSRGESGRSSEASVTAELTFHINFSASKTEVPQGYLNDVGAAYGARVNGLGFGWNVNNAANMIERNDPAAPDELQDSLGQMQAPSNPNAWWAIALPDGTYQVHLVAGDPDAANSNYQINVSDAAIVGSTLKTFNPVLAISGTPTSSNP